MDSNEVSPRRNQDSSRQQVEPAAQILIVLHDHRLGCFALNMRQYFPDQILISSLISQSVFNLPQAGTPSSICYGRGQRFSLQNVTLNGIPIVQVGAATRADAVEGKDAPFTKWAIDNFVTHEQVCDGKRFARRVGNFRTNLHCSKRCRNLAADAEPPARYQQSSIALQRGMRV